MNKEIKNKIDAVIDKTIDWRNLTTTEQSEYEQPIFISPAFKKLINQASKEDAKALRRQVEFSPLEKNISQQEIADPLGEHKYCVRPYLVHQYENRVLLLTTPKCLSYCRYCFRRGFTARQGNFINDREIKVVCKYIKENPQIKEILVSGGDPLSGGIKNLKNLLQALRNSSSKLIIRLCTRSPIFAPELFTAELLAFLKTIKPLWIIPHINHPAELGEAQRLAFTQISECGIPMQSQTVLLKNVNDSPEILIALFNELTCIGIKPGYLFQLDMAAGTKHFRVPLKEALSIWKILEKKLSGLSRPQFAVDLPNGGGKFSLSALTTMEKIVKKDLEGNFSAIGIDGEIYNYRADY